MSTCFRCGEDLRGGRLCRLCRGTKIRTPRNDKPVTLREWQIIQLVVQGQPNKIIGYELGITEGTVKEYLNRIYHKTKARNRTDLAVMAFSGKVSFHPATDK